MGDADLINGESVLIFIYVVLRVEFLGFEDCLAKSSISKRQHQVVLNSENRTFCSNCYSDLKIVVDRLITGTCNNLVPKFLIEHIKCGVSIKLRCSF